MLLLSVSSSILLAASAASSCSARVAEPATVRLIAENPLQYEGRCVAVDGVMRGLMLYGDVDGIYLRPTESGTPSSSGAQLGLDNLRWLSDEYRHVSIVGTVGDCENVRACVRAAAGPDEIVMVSGYCHYASGAFLSVQRVRARRGKPLERQMGMAARADYGNLEPAPPDWPHRAQVEGFADAFITALRAKDRAALAAMHFGNVGEPEEPDVLDFLLLRSKSPFAAIRTSSIPPQRQILIERLPLDWTTEDDVHNDDDNYAATVCFCKESDCAGRWPIAAFDADNLPTRPYACVEVGPYVLYKRGEVPHFETAVGTSGLVEPRRHDRQIQ